MASVVLDPHTSGVLQHSSNQAGQRPGSIRCVLKLRAVRCALTYAGLTVVPLLYIPWTWPSNIQSSLKCDCKQSDPMNNFTLDGANFQIFRLAGTGVI